jgi:hypothetical protein
MFTRSSVREQTRIGAPDSFGRQLAFAFVKVLPTILQQAFAKIDEGDLKSLG